MHRCDFIIEQAYVLDGSDVVGEKADVAIESDRIAAVGDLNDWSADGRINGEGCVLAPGFIDVHTHDDLAVLNTPAMDFKVSQGVTTVIAGNCGLSAAPLNVDGVLPPPFPMIGDGVDFQYPSVAAYRTKFDATQPAINLALLVGHSSLRVSAMSGDLERESTLEERRHMKKLLAEALGEGCIGLSTGLDYPPAMRASTEEIIDLVTVLADFKPAVYTTHMRNEGDGVVEAVEETLYTGRESRVPVVISHHKCAGPKNYGRSKHTLALIGAAQRDQAVGLDVYPYTASSTSLIPRFIRTAEDILITYSEPHPECSTKRLSDVADEWGCTLVEAAQRLYPAGAIYFQMDEGDLKRILAFPSTMVGSDGLPGRPHPHPRLWGTFPRVLARYVRDQKLLTLSRAVHKMTGLSARTFGLQERGFIKVGYHADLVLFNPETVQDLATFEDPERPAAGIEKVIVNGAIAWSEGKHTGKRAGTFVTH